MTDSRDIIKIVITGGPCAGKTTALARIKETFEKQGYRLLIIPETATELISSGIAPWTMHSSCEYQRFQMMLQLEKERIYLEAARNMVGEGKILAVFDRGAMDNRAYITDEEYKGILDSLSLDMKDVLSRYDGVFHLVTAAKGAARAYTLANNNARTETPEQAASIDDRLIYVWKDHPHSYIIDNSTDLDGKIGRLTDEISGFLAHYQ